MSDEPSPLGGLLREAPSDRLVEAVESHLRAQYGATEVEVLLADYNVAGLWPVLTDLHPMAGPLVERSTAARCFSSQQAVIERTGDGGGVRIFVPLVVWGERLGVLVVDITGAVPEDRLAGLHEVGDELALALLGADRSTDRYRRSRRRQRMTMAAEMQWDMLPGRGLRRPEFQLAGQLEPAYSVNGDHFDWAVTGERLTVTVLNGDGEGVAATLLSAVAVSAMRNARRSGGDLVEQAELASDAIYHQYGGHRHAATLLLEVNLPSGVVTAIDAGSPIALRQRGRNLDAVALDRQLPLGMFADARYTPQRFRLTPGDRLFVVSDGVHAASPSGHSSFGERALATAVRATRLQPANEAVGTVMRALHEYHEGDHLKDDAVIVCLDWRGTGFRSAAGDGDERDADADADDRDGAERSGAGRSEDGRTDDA